MSIAAWVTLIFAALEFTLKHYPEKCPAISGLTADWRPGDLPPVEKNSHSGKKPRGYAQAVAEVVFGFLFLVWLLLIPQHPYLLMGPGALYLQASSFQLAPVWIQFFWWLVALNVLQLGWHSFNLARGSWQHPHPAEQLASKVFGLIPLLLLVTVPDRLCITLKHPLQDQAHYGAALNTINLSIHRGLLVVCAIVVLQLICDIARISLDAYRTRVSASR